MVVEEEMVERGMLLVEKLQVMLDMEETQPKLRFIFTILRHSIAELVMQVV